MTLARFATAIAVTLAILGYVLQYAASAADRAVYINENNNIHKAQKVLDEEQNANLLSVEQMVLALGDKIDTLVESLDRQATEKNARMKSLRSLCRRGKLPEEGPDCKEVEQWENNRDG